MRPLGGRRVSLYERRGTWFDLLPSTVERLMRVLILDGNPYAGVDSIY